MGLKFFQGDFPNDNLKVENDISSEETLNISEPWKLSESKFNKDCSTKQTINYLRIISDHNDSEEITM